MIGKDSADHLAEDVVETCDHLISEVDVGPPQARLRVPSRARDQVRSASRAWTPPRPAHWSWLPTGGKAAFLDDTRIVAVNVPGAPGNFFYVFERA